MAERTSIVLRASPYYAIVVGAIMLLYWVVSLAISEPILMRDLAARPWDMGLSMVAEIVTALVLVAGGWIRLRKGGLRILVLGLGMLTYTVISTTGWSLEERLYPMTAGMGLLFVINVAILVALLRGRARGGDGGQ